MRRLLNERRAVAGIARRLFEAGRNAKAHEYLTGYVGKRLLGGLDLGERLVSAVERQTRERFGLRMPAGRDLPGETARAESQSTNRDTGLSGPTDAIVFCYREGLDDYPREHGSYRNMAGQLLPDARTISKRRFLDAMAAVRERHDPARDWRAFAEAAWRQAMRPGEGGR